MESYQTVSMKWVRLLHVNFTLVKLELETEQQRKVFWRGETGKWAMGFSCLCTGLYTRVTRSCIIALPLQNLASLPPGSSDLCIPGLDWVPIPAAISGPDVWDPT